MKRNWWLILILILIFAAAFFLVAKKQNAKVIINGKTFQVEVARTDTERAYGLMNRRHLDRDKGMLFVFDHANIYPFWMKNTLIPLDIIYINDGKIVDITTLPPQNGNNIPQYTPTEKAQYVLELNANSGAKTGDEVKIKY